MASSPVDVRGMMARQMVERLANRGGVSQGGASPDAAGAQLSQQVSELHGADPQMLVKAGEQVKSMLMVIQTRTAFQVPEARQHAATAMKSIDAMLKALQQATATANTVNSPIVNNAGMNPVQNPGSGEPSSEGMAAQ